MSNDPLEELRAAAQTQRLVGHRKGPTPPGFASSRSTPSQSGIEWLARLLDGIAYGIGGAIGALLVIYLASRLYGELKLAEWERSQEQSRAEFDRQVGGAGHVQTPPKR